MSKTFSVNNRYLGLGGIDAPNFCDAWYKVKQTLVNANWTVSQSGCATLDGNDINTTAGAGVITNQSKDSGDILTLDKMKSSKVWWIVRDPAGKREILFFRPQPITVHWGAANILPESSYMSTLIVMLESPLSLQF
jgi:hypothetical protein